MVMMVGTAIEGLNISINLPPRLTNCVKYSNKVFITEIFGIRGTRLDCNGALPPRGEREKIIGGKKIEEGEI